MRVVAKAIDKLNLIARCRVRVTNEDTILLGNDYTFSVFGVMP
ncbi:hypothetical protein FDUTEX481_04191 [Tolypothrix sp. PCC 7601]|nr:hypothetical protein FDUTEX481_04191 [Tolypothrix sp. PCC 7601]